MGSINLKQVTKDFGDVSVIKPIDLEKLKTASLSYLLVHQVVVNQHY